MDFEGLHADKDLILKKHFTSGRGGKKIEKVVIHYNAANLSIEQCYNVWQNREASAHYQVQSDGLIGQLVHDWDTAWHAGDFNVNQTSIGIEHANRSDGTITPECLEAGAHLTAAICLFYNLGIPQWGVNVFPHKWFSPTACPGELYGSQKNDYIRRAQDWYLAMKDGKGAPKPRPSKPSKPSDDIEVDGLWGKATTKAAQIQFGTTADSIVSSQSAYWKDNFAGCTGGWEWKDDEDAEGSALIWEIQTWLADKGFYNGTIDGIAGRNTWQGLERAAGYEADEIGLEYPSNTIKWFQGELNKGTFRN